MQSDTLITLYSRVGCHLCDVMKEQIEKHRDRVRVHARASWTSIKTRSCERSMIGMCRCCFVDGEKIAKYQLDEAMLLRRLDGTRSDER